MVKRHDEMGARCRACGGHFVAHGTPDERAHARCQCSPNTPLEECKACVSGHGAHPDWCLVVQE